MSAISQRLMCHFWMPFSDQNIKKRFEFINEHYTCSISSWSTNYFNVHLHYLFSIPTIVLAMFLHCWEFLFPSSNINFNVLFYDSQSLHHDWFFFCLGSLKPRELFPLSLCYLTCFCFNHNYNKILTSDWLSTVWFQH